MDSIKNNSKLAVVDWGTTNFRAYLLDGKGCCLDSIENSYGLVNVNKNFEVILDKLIGRWLEDGSVSVLVCGMAGSRSGWIEAPYIDCPLNIGKLANSVLHVKSFNGGNCWMVPGVHGTSISGCYDVMRGEEIQVIGSTLISEKEYEFSPDVMCFPGTHNKWTRNSINGMTSFTTTMTGDVFNAVRRCSILSSSMTENNDWSTESFDKGLEISRKPGGLLNHLFTVRSRSVSKEGSDIESNSYLSGILIGNEINNLSIDSNSNIVVVANKELCSKYIHALGYFGLNSISIISKKATIYGAIELYRNI